MVRQMLRRVQMDEPGDTRFIVGEQVERADVLVENEKVQAEGRRQAAYSSPCWRRPRPRCRPIPSFPRRRPGNHTVC
jgi:hypothetical protein